MALPASPTSSTITAYGAPFNQPIISRMEQLWIEIYAKAALLKNAGGTDYTSNLRQLQQDAATLCAGMSRQEIEAALTGTYATEANTVQSGVFPSSTVVGTIVAKLSLMLTRDYDAYVRCKMLLRYQLLRLAAA